MSDRFAGKDIRFVGIDREPDMIEQATRQIGKRMNVELVIDEIGQFDYEPADLIIAYYTVQFVPPKRRQLLIKRIFESLNWGGGFLLFEKVRATDARFQDMMTTIYTDFKIDQGYSAEEILGKIRSLKGILEPFSSQANLDILERAGFKDTMSIMKWACFEGFLAIK